MRTARGRFGIRLLLQHLNRLVPQQADIASRIEQPVEYPFRCQIHVRAVVSPDEEIIDHGIEGAAKEHPVEIVIPDV